MPPLKAKIEGDSREALKSKDVTRVETLRLLLAALHNREIEKRTQSGESELDDDEVLEVAGREAKKRKEAIEFFLKGNRGELAEKEKRELAVLAGYLPAEADEEEVNKIIEEVIRETGARSEKEFGKVMSGVMKTLKGRVDAKCAGEIIKERLRALQEIFKL